MLGLTQNDISDIIRFAAGMSILLYAAFTDFKYRIARDELWIIAGVAGLLLLPFSAHPLSNMVFYLALSVLVMLPFSFLVMILRMGGADAKALLAIAVLTPIFPRMGCLPLWVPVVELPFAMTVFINSLLIYLAIPLVLLLWNLKNGVTEFPFCLLGYKMKASEIGKKFVWPMENIEDGERKKKIMPQQDVDVSVFGDDVIWVTPKVPFLIPLAAGYFISFVLGDILYGIISLFI